MKTNGFSRDIVKNSLATFVVLLVSVLGVKLLMASHAATGATLSLTSTAATVAPGSTLSVTMKEDSGTDPVNSVQASLNYDATQLQYVSMTEGTSFPTIAANSTSTAGVIRVGRATSTPVTGVNNIVTLNFKVLASSGSIGLTYDKNFSFVVRSTDNTDILALTTGANFTVSGTSTGSASISLSPGSGTATTGSTFTVTVRENSGTTTVKSVQASIGYDPAQLQYVNLSEGGSFTNITTTDVITAGKVQVARSVQAGSLGISGDNPIVTLSFKVLAKSGTAGLTIDKTQSSVVASSTTTNILGTVAGSSFTITQASTGGSGTLSLSPNSGTYTNGSTISVVVKATSPTAALTTVQATLNYPSSQLQYQSITEGGVYTTTQRTNTSTPGVVDIIRSVSGGSAGLVGTNPVVTVNFRVIGTSGAAAVIFGSTSALFDDSGTGTNILNLAGSTTASYTISTPPPTCTANPSQPGAPVKTSAGYTTISLAWTASTPGAGCTIAGYNVTRDSAKGGPVTNAVTYTDAGLQASSTHTYMIQAYDTAGHVSSNSTTVSMTTKPDDMAPTIPTGFTAAAPGAVSVNLAWNSSTDFPNPGGVGVAGYKIYRNGSSTATYTINSGSSFVDTNVTASTTYSYIVTAYDKLGYESSPSNIVTAKTATPTPSCTGSPSAPTGQTAVSIGLTTVDTSWTASSAASGCTLAGYKVYRNAAFVGSSATTNYRDSGLTPATSYTYTVQSYDTAGHASAFSPGKVVITAADTTAPTAPTGFTAGALSSSQVNLAWTGSTDNIGVTNYKIYRAGTLLTTTTGTARSYSDTQVSAGTDYSYSISATDIAGNESSRTTATPNPVRTPAAADTTAPTAPTSLRVLAVSTTSASVAWNASTDNVRVVGYHIYRGGVYINDSASLSYTDLALSPKTSYVYTVKAYDASGNTSSASAALSVSTLAPVACALGDLNCDKTVDIFDLSVMLAHWGEVNVPVRSGDINQDGKVDVFDLSTLLSHLGDKG